MNELNLSKAQVGRFAVVKLWPNIKTAEDECIARLKAAANLLGLECFEIHADGERLDQSGVFISRSDVDFVIHLHYDTPKLYDAFSFVALWNPLQFYHEWGYSRTSRNLTTHDDFLSCSCESADDHVSRMIRNESNHAPPFFSLYHSMPDVVHSPSLGDFKLFYVGINWEAISRGQSRHQEVLKQLDITGMLRIYGPEIFQGVRVWDGYKSYIKEIPFDGISMIKEIASAGISLVLSSQAHKDAGLMSNRLFESVAAGALVICDENPFAKKYFGDSLLYIDGRLPVEKIILDIKNHVNWAVSNPEKALEKIKNSQDIFRIKFSLNENIKNIYFGLDDRKKLISEKQNPLHHSIPIQVNFIMSEFSDSVLKNHLDSVENQDYADFSSRLVIDKNFSVFDREKIYADISKLKRKVEVFEIDFFEYSADNKIFKKKRLGEIVQELVDCCDLESAFMLVAPNEIIFSNHLSVLSGALQRDPSVNCAATAAIHKRGNMPIHGVHELIDFGHADINSPIGYGRFIFRKSSFPEDLKIALPYLDGRTMAILVGNENVDQQMVASVVIDLDVDFPGRNWSEVVENKIIEDFCPGVFVLKTGFGPKPALNNGPIVYDNPIVHRVPLKKLVGLFLNYQWVKLQFYEIRKNGFTARINILRQALGL